MTLPQFVYGLGQLLVERVKAGAAPSLAATVAATGGSEQPMTVTAGAGAQSYAVDIRTAEGSWNHLAGVTLDPGNTFELSFSSLAPGVTNWVRIKREGEEGAVYSPAVRMVYNPDVAPEASNQIQVVSAGRSGTDVVLRWGLKTANGKKTRAYFRRADTGDLLLLTPQALAANQRTLILSSQALTIPCGEFLLSQQAAGGPESPLTPPLFFAGVDLGLGHEAGCVPGHPDPPSEPPPDLWADYYHARDHLGNLRVVLDEAGAKVEAHDYYPFGQEIIPEGKSPGTASRRKFTGHERDEDSGLDYMLARYYGSNLGRFFSVDPGNDIEIRIPQTWNFFTYVRNNPIVGFDPSGEKVEKWDITYQGPNQVSTAKPDADSGFSKADIKNLGSELTTRGLFVRINVIGEVSLGDFPANYEIKQEAFGFSWKDPIKRFEKEESPESFNVTRSGNKIIEYDSPGATVPGRPSASVNYKVSVVFQTWAVDKKGNQSGPSLYWCVKFDGKKVMVFLLIRADYEKYRKRVLDASPGGGTPHQAP